MEESEQRGYNRSREPQRYTPSRKRYDDEQYFDDPEFESYSEPQEELDDERVEAFDNHSFGGREDGNPSQPFNYDYGESKQSTNYDYTKNNPYKNLNRYTHNVSLKDQISENDESDNVVENLQEMVESEHQDFFHTPLYSYQKNEDPIDDDDDDYSNNRELGDPRQRDRQKNYQEIILTPKREREDPVTDDNKLIEIFMKPKNGTERKLVYVGTHETPSEIIHKFSPTEKKKRTRDYYDGQRPSSYRESTVKKRPTYPKSPNNNRRQIATEKKLEMNHLEEETLRQKDHQHRDQNL